MTADLKNQLRQFGEWHDERQDKIDAARVVEVVRPVGLTTPATRTRRRPGLVLGVAALVAILMIGIPLLLDFGDSGESEPADQVPFPDDGVLPVPPEEAVDEVAPSSEQVPTPWYRVVDDEGLLDVELNDVIEFDGRLVAVGNAVRFTAARVSEDGVTWSRAVIETPNGNPDPGELSVVVEGGSGLIALGSNGLDVFEVWTSADGATWSALPQEAIPDEPVAVTDVVAAGPGFLAVGRQGFEQGCAQCDPPTTVPALWTSADGLQWERVPHDPSMFGDEGGLFSVAAGNGHIVAIGSPTGRLDGDVSVVWTSTDGLTWSRSTVQDQRFDIAFFEGVFVTSFGWSVDGSTWTPYEPLFVPGRPGFTGNTIFEVVGDRLIAVQRPAMGFPATVHVSTDGRSWTDMGAVAPGVEAVSGGGPGMVAVGDGGVVLWFDEPADAADYGELIELEALPLE